MQRVPSVPWEAGSVARLIADMLGQDDAPREVEEWVNSTTDPLSVAGVKLTQIEQPKCKRCHFRTPALVRHCLAVQVVPHIWGFAIVPRLGPNLRV